MDGIVFVAGLLMGVSYVGLRSGRVMRRPGALMTLALLLAAAWYAFA